MNSGEISFVNTDTEQIASGMIADYESRTGRTLYPADPVRQLILWAAAVDVQLRVAINSAAKQNIPRYARGAYLDLVAELFKDARRLPPEPAQTTLWFTLSVPLEAETVIPAGTRVTADGKIVFATTAELVIPAGESAGTIGAVCQTVGTRGNGLLPRQLNRLVDVFPYAESVENTTESAGGADEETDGAFYLRMNGSMESFSTAGPSGAYEYHAKSASALVADVKASSPSPGVVDVRVLLTGGALPTEELLAKITDTLSAAHVRPLTDFVTVAPPELVHYDVDFTYFIQTGESAQAIAARVEDAIARYKRWQGEKMGRDVNPSKLHQLLMDAGVKRVELRSPAFAVVAENAVAAAGAVTALSGGAEDE